MTERTRNFEQRIGPVVENVAESTAACLVAMVQGNLLAMTLGHWLIASQTGVVAGVLTSIAIAVSRSDRRWAVAILLGIVTAIVDFFVHPGSFGAVATEAAITGVTAALLSLAVATVVRLFRHRKAA